MKVWPDLVYPTTPSPEWFADMAYTIALRYGYTEAYAKAERAKALKRWQDFYQTQQAQLLVS